MEVNGQLQSYYNSNKFNASWIKELITFILFSLSFSHGSDTCTTLSYFNDFYNILTIFLYASRNSGYYRPRVLYSPPTVPI